MAAIRISTSKDRETGNDSSSDPEKQLGTTYVVGDTPAASAPEYVEFMRLKEHFESDPKAHRRLIRLLDFRILPFLFLYYLLNSLDKSNAGNVKIYTFLQDAHMTSHQFNLALTWYFFTYAGLEAPSK